MRKLMLAALLLLLPGCAATCLEKVAATEAGITRAYSLNSKLYTDNVLGKDDTLRILKGIDAANIAADSAAPLCRIGDPSAFDYITQANAMLGDVLQTMEDYQ